MNYGWRLKDEVGKRYGRLVVLERATEVKHHNPHWRCQCDCGSICLSTGSNLRSGKMNSCGCIQRERPNGLRHGHSRKLRTPTYQTWVAMRNRCYRKSQDNFSRYGGKGIQVCARWFDFANFLSDMGERPMGMTLDRINSDGHYMPSNCRWATLKEQRRRPSLPSL
jgi:hypothetical protein